jgi:adenylate kinase family enzyme
MRTVVIGNSGGGKSTLARRLVASSNFQHIEIDDLLWQPGWQLTPVEIYNAGHARLIAGDSWIIDGLGRLDSIPERLARATDIVLVDMPLWMHFWLAAERQLQWTTGTIEHPLAGLTTMPPTEALFGRSGTSIKTGCRRSGGWWRLKNSAASGCCGSNRFPIWMDSILTP